MSRTTDIPGEELHISVCSCPHVNLVITDENQVPLAHLAFGPDAAEAVGRDILKAVAEARAKTRLHGMPPAEGSA